MTSPPDQLAQYRVSIDNLDAISPHMPAHFSSPACGGGGPRSGSEGASQ